MFLTACVTWHIAVAYKDIKKRELDESSLLDNNKCAQDDFELAAEVISAVLFQPFVQLCLTTQCYCAVWV